MFGTNYVHIRMKCEYMDEVSDTFFLKILVISIGMSIPMEFKHFILTLNPYSSNFNQEKAVMNL